MEHKRHKDDLYKSKTPLLDRTPMYRSHSFLVRNTEIFSEFPADNIECDSQANSNDASLRMFI